MVAIKNTKLVSHQIKSVRVLITNYLSGCNLTSLSQTKIPGISRHVTSESYLNYNIGGIVIIRLPLSFNISTIIHHRSSICLLTLPTVCIVITLIGLTSFHLCAYPKTGHGFPTPCRGIFLCSMFCRDR